jgi:hypothetical protein
MFALVKNDNSIKLFQPHVLWEDKNGTQYSPDQLLTMNSQQKQDLGIYDVAYAASEDDRFYRVVQNDPTFDAGEKIVKVTFASIPNALEDEGDAKGMKSRWIAQVNATANSILTQTDWMLVRKIERSVDVPSASAAKRVAVVTESNRLVTAITAASNITDFISAVQSANWSVAQ